MSSPTVTDQVPYNQLKMNQLFQIGRELYQVSSIYPGHLTAQWLYPKQDRTRVVSVDRKDYENNAHRPTKHLIAKYEEAWGFVAGSTR